VAVKRSAPGLAYAEHWDRIAPKWTAEVFNTLRCARSPVVREGLKTAASTSSNIADFGCGTGTYLPLLSRLFDEVHGFEQSQRCVEIARKRMRTRRNVKVDVAHRANPPMRSRFDAVLCVNVALHPERREWRQVLRAMKAMLRPRGRFLLVVPALESAALVTRARRPHIDPLVPAVKHFRPRIRPGVVRFGGVPTKHYSAAELRSELKALGLGGIRVQRVEYTWRSHGITPPPSLRAEKPWDWFVTARRPAARRA